MEKIRLNLRMFDGEGGTAPAGSGVGAADAGQQTAENGRVAGGEGTGEAKKTFDELISGEYKADYDKRVQELMNKRWKNAKEQEAKLAKQQELIDLIAMRYGVDGTNIDGIRSEIEKDSAYWEDAAAKEGMSVQQYQRVKQMEMENRRLKQINEQAEKDNQKQRMYVKWNQEAEELKGFYSDFDLEAELNNPDFIRLLGSGVNMKTIYEVIHKDDLYKGAMAKAAQTAAKKQADAIRSGQSRPREGAAAGNAGFASGKDISKMTRKEILELGERAKRGEQIKF